MTISAEKDPHFEKELINSEINSRHNIIFHWPSEKMAKKAENVVFKASERFFLKNTRYKLPLNFETFQAPDEKNLCPVNNIEI